jgi:hypothetical protein
MTTESKQAPRSGGGRALLGAAIWASAAGLVVAGIGALASGDGAAYGALVGTALCVTVFGFGAFTLNVVAGLLPAAALMFALLTYTLQVALLALAFLALSRSGALDSALDRRWLAGAVITATITWLTAQTWFATRTRITTYDLPDGPPEAGAR